MRIQRINIAGALQERCDRLLNGEARPEIQNRFETTRNCEVFAGIHLPVLCFSLRNSAHL